MHCMQLSWMQFRVSTFEVTIRPVTGTIAYALYIRYRNYSHSTIHLVERKRELTYSFFLIYPTIKPSFQR